ncbi:MAG: peptidoglycan DD-metalloendopeptidase family protein [Undibacterium sp.]|uniref:peptidoglycan DD-metalloendopeptidase family protein n=1 Tax=Undibacterium sp. TaxID=1914977 RepID=UPI00272025E9|nr:peptidoglycan DD-metalloendopeptidase family protein [Undibacterium sp.]MDO8653642.1 peptidoglycan DD-metalloendopeptidase family protein [Undibacterium sp.]
MSKNKIPLVVQILFTGALISIISACTTPLNNAPVVDRIGDVNSNSGKSGPVVVSSASKSLTDTRISYVVKRGDTLFRIALDHGQNYSDIVAWNSLKNPNDIKVDQVLRVAPPDGNANSAVQTASVSSGAGVEVRSLSSVNLATNKTGPRGDKRPYSEVTLAELQKTDVAVTSGIVPVIKPEIVIAKPIEKIVAQPAVETDTVDWMWPTEGRVISNFDDAKNKGLDISGKLGQDVFAAGAGKVMYEGSGIRGYGNLVIIKHNNNLLSAYAHNKVNLVKEGQAISRGQKIAEMGNSDSDSIKLHFEIRQQGKPVDPAKFLPGR